MMSAGSWEPPLVRVDGARDRPLRLDDAWAAPTALESLAPVEIVEPDRAAEAGEPELLFLEAARAAPDQRPEILAAGLLACGLRLLAVARHLDPPSPELVHEIWELLIRWLEGADLGDRADEVTLRARVAWDLLDVGGSGQEARLAAGVLLRLPTGHLLRDEAAARRGLLRHLRAQRSIGSQRSLRTSIPRKRSAGSAFPRGPRGSGRRPDTPSPPAGEAALRPSFAAGSQQAQADPVWELLALELLVTERLVGHRTVLRYLRRAFELRDRLDDPELRRRVLVVAAGYHLRRALDETLPPATRHRAAAQAVTFAERLAAEDGTPDQDDWLLLATAYEAAGRDRDAARAYAEGLPGRDPGGSGGPWRAALQYGLLLADLDDPQAAAGQLAGALPAIEREYLTASEEQLPDIGEAFTTATTTLALCQARTGAPEAAFASIERSKSLRARHRAALHDSADGRRFLELERTLVAWQRGATIRFTSTRPVDAGSGPDSVVLSPGVAARLPADERIHQLRRELAATVPGTVPAPPAVADWSGRLADAEAVVSLGTGGSGTWWGAVTAASAREGRVAADGLRTDWPSERWTALVTEPEASSWLVALLTRRGADLQRELDELLAAVDDFLAPLAGRLAELGVRRLRLVPHRWLRIIPFWAAPALAPFTICVQASGAVPRTPDTHGTPPSWPAGGQPQCAAVPRTPAADGTPPGRPAGGQPRCSVVPRTPGTDGALREVLAVADPTGDLWAAAAEPEIIAERLSARGVTVSALVRTAAVKEDVLAAAQTADVLHFAGHGRTDIADPERSALWLHSVAAYRAVRGGDDPLARMAASITDGWREARPGLREVVIAGGGLLSEYDLGDGVLERRLEHPLGSTLWIRGGRTAELWTAEEITVGESLPRCQLAVLTACEAAGGGLSRVDEAAGLPAALTAAGVPTVIASLWPVEDDLAVLFTDRFYRALADALGGDLDVDVAALVHRVRTELRTMPRSEAAAALGALIDRTRDVPAQARLKPARARRASGPEHPFADPVHWAAFGVFGTGVLKAGG